jgi:non-ribosomal peptide synthetase component E (peptide arylation enzyme)
MEGMVKCSANYVPLTPISFLERSAIVYRDRVSVAYGDIKYTWKETHERCVRLASALAHLGISPGDVVTTSCYSVSIFFYFFSLVLKRFCSDLLTIFGFVSQNIGKFIIFFFLKWKFEA